MADNFLNLGGVGFELGLAGGDKFGRDLKKAESEGQGFVASLIGKFKELGALAFSFNELRDAIGGVMAPLKDLVFDAGDFIDEAVDMADSLGITTTQLMGFEQAFANVGLPVEKVQAAMGNLAGIAMRDLDAKMLALANGTKAPITAFDKLGISIVGTDGKLKEQGVLFQEVAEKINALTNPAEKAAYAKELLGRAGVKMLPAFAELKQIMAEVAGETEDLGLQMGVTEREMSGKLEGATGRLNRVFNGFLVTIGAPLMGPMTALVNGMASVGTSILVALRQTGLLDLALNAIKIPLNAVGGVLTEVSQIVREFIPLISDLVSGNVEWGEALRVAGLFVFDLASRSELLRNAMILLLDIWIDGIEPAWRALSEEYGPALAEVMGTVRDVFGVVADAVGFLWERLQAGAVYIAQAIGIVGLARAGFAILGGVMSALVGVAGAVIGIVIGMLSPFNLLVAGVALALNYFGGLSGVWQAMKPYADQMRMALAFLWSEFASGQVILDAVRNGLGAAASAIMSGAGATMTWEGAMTGLKFALGVVAGALVGVWEAIKLVTAYIIGPAIAGVGVFVNGFLTGIGAISAYLGDWYGSVIDGWDGTFGNLLEREDQWAADVLATMGEMWEGALALAGEWLDPIWTSITEWWDGVWDYLYDGAAMWWDDFMQGFADMWASIKGGVADFAANVMAQLTAAMAPLNTIVNAILHPQQAVEGMIEKFTGGTMLYSYGASGATAGAGGGSSSSLSMGDVINIHGDFSAGDDSLRKFAQTFHQARQRKYIG